MPSRRAPRSAPRDRPGAVPATVAARLYALPPDRFLAAREALAGRLAEGQDPLASAVRQLRRPVGLAWMLDHLALAEPAGVEGLLRAGDRLRAGQQAALEGKGADALHAAEAEVREAARALRLAATPVFERAGRRAEPVVTAHLEVLLRALATAPEEERSRFEKGLLEREPQVGGALEGLSGLPPAAAAPAREPAPAGATASAVPAAEARGAGEARIAAAAELGREREELERERAERERAEELRLRAAAEESRRREELERQRTEEARRRAEAEAEARERARRRAEARRALTEVERVAEEQRALVEQRRAAAEAAQRRLDVARAELSRAEAALEAAEAEASRARDAVQRLGGDAGDTESESAAHPGPQ